MARGLPWALCRQENPKLLGLAASAILKPDAYGRTAVDYAIDLQLRQALRVMISALSRAPPLVLTALAGITPLLAARYPSQMKPLLNLATMEKNKQRQVPSGNMSRSMWYYYGWCHSVPSC